MKNQFILIPAILLFLFSSSCKEDSNDPAPNNQSEDCKLTQVNWKVSFLEEEHVLIWNNDVLMGWYNTEGDSVKFTYTDGKLTKIEDMISGYDLIVKYAGSNPSEVLVMEGTTLLWVYKLKYNGDKLIQFSYWENDGPQQIQYGVVDIEWNGNNVSRTIYKEDYLGTGTFDYIVEIYSPAFDSKPNPLGFIPVLYWIDNVAEDDYGIMQSISGNNLRSGTVIYEENGTRDTSDFSVDIEYNTRNWPSKITEDDGFIQSLFTYDCK